MFLHEFIGEALAGDGKQRKNGAAEGRNRRALGDIGNLVTVRGVDGKPQPQISRPVTRFVSLSVTWKNSSISVLVPFVDFFPFCSYRSFCAQLLANAQAAAAAENNKVCLSKQPYFLHFSFSFLNFRI